MRNNRKKILYWMPLLLLALASCTGKKSKLANLMADKKNGLLQEKTKNGKTIVMELLPPYDRADETSNTAAGFYKVKLLLKNNEKVKGHAAMQYMNFEIKNCFYAVLGGDTMPAAICERIPGINENEFMYMAFFNRPDLKNDAGVNLRVCVADTTAGFGTAEFEIKNESVKKLEAIK